MAMPPIGRSVSFAYREAGDKALDQTVDGLQKPALLRERAQPIDLLFVSTVTLAEIRFGIELVRPGQTR